ncbi:HCNGP-like protein-domain-containing protein [Hypoxylon crocopeplum]|nr:HCNGP-like protein-domain-containing protein [Hypoxylon crocopeplum]
MAGLVSYESSDEEEVAPQLEPKLLKPTQDTAVDTNGKSVPPRRPNVPSQEPDGHPAPTPAPTPAPIIGPQIGPTAAAGPRFPPLEEALLEDDEEGAGLGLPPGSPYTATRALIRDLTLPPLPNTDIPPSPPGSPSPGTSAKFERFLELKKQGVHFNTKVAQNPSLSNPALMDKLLGFVDLAAPADQYRTTLGEDIWDPTVFPRWAYKEQLKQSQADIEKARARARGAPVEFVTAGDGQGLAPGAQQGSSLGSVPKQSTGKRKTRFDT